MYFTGLIIAVCTFLVIGVFHPVVIKCEYYFGTRLWWLFLLLGIACVVSALFISDVLVSALCGVTGASCLWSIGEIFEQRERVKKGWFPMNPKRRHEYEDNDRGAESNAANDRETESNVTNDREAESNKKNY